MKKLILLIVFIFISCIGFSQVIHDEEKTNYVSEDGKLYWNKSLPVTIHLGIGESNKIKLNESFFLDTEGVNYLRTKWKVDSTGKYILPQQEVVWRVYADSKPPTTKATFIADESYIFRGETYYSDDVKVKLEATDALSGVKKIYYSTDSLEFIVYDSLISFGKQKNVTLHFYSVDNVGNIEDISILSYNYDNNNLSFSIDADAPITAIDDIDTLLSPRDIIKLRSTDQGVGVHEILYRFDTSDFVFYKKPIKLETLNDGVHVLNYYAQDWINNREEEKEFKFYLDAVSPEIELVEEIIKDNLTHLRKVEIVAYDNFSGVDKIMVQLNGDSEFKEYLKPFYMDISHEKIKIKVTDKMGNESLRVVTYQIEE